MRVPPLCLLLMNLPWSRGSVYTFYRVLWLLKAWVIFWFTFPRGLLPFSLGSAGLWAFLPSTYFFIPSIACYHFLPHHYATLATMLFDPILLGPFGPTIYPSPNDSAWSLVLFLRGLRALVSHFLIGHPWPICFSWASLAFFLILLSHGLLLTPLGFLGPITLSFTLGAHRLSISPLLSLLALLWAYCGPFSLFYILLKGLFLLSLRAPLGLFASSEPVLWACDPFISAI